MGHGSDVPRITRHGTRKKGVSVASEVGDNLIHEVLRELGGLGST